MVKIKENSTLQRRHLAEAFRFPDGFLESLLSLIRKMVEPEPRGQYTAKEMVASLTTILEETKSESLRCCASPDRPSSPSNLSPTQDSLGSTAAINVPGADVNTHDGEFVNALQEPSVEGHEWLRGLLLDRGADVNIQGALWQCASSSFS
jgi:hypothetical protein